jgi:hypothetical protein
MPIETLDETQAPASRLYELMVDAAEVRTTQIPFQKMDSVVAAMTNPRGKPPSSWPAALSLSWLGGEELVPADMPNSTILPIWSEWAVTRFGADFARSGRLLPLHIDGTPYHALAVDLFADCLDTKRSSPVLRYRVIERPVFRPEAIPDAPAFRVPQIPMTVLWTGAFVRRLMAAGATGIQPRLVWSDDPTRAAVGCR